MGSTQGTTEVNVLFCNNSVKSWIFMYVCDIEPKPNKEDRERAEEERKRERERKRGRVRGRERGRKRGRAVGGRERGREMKQVR